MGRVEGPMCQLEARGGLVITGNLDRVPLLALLLFDVLKKIFIYFFVVMKRFGILLASFLMGLLLQITSSCY